MFFSTRLPLSSVIELCRVLRHYLGAGLTLRDVFRQQAARGDMRLRPVAGRIAAELDEGGALEDALKRSGRRLPAALDGPGQRRRTDRHVARSLHRTGKILRPPAAAAAQLPQPGGLADPAIRRRHLRPGRADLHHGPHPAGQRAVRAALRPGRPRPVGAGRGVDLPGVGVRRAAVFRGPVPRRHATAGRPGVRGRLPLAHADPRPVPAGAGADAVLPGAAADAGDGDADRPGAAAELPRDRQRGLRRADSTGRSPPSRRARS